MVLISPFHSWFLDLPVANTVATMSLLVYVILSNQIHSWGMARQNVEAFYPTVGSGGALAPSTAARVNTDGRLGNDSSSAALIVSDRRSKKRFTLPSHLSAAE